MLNLLQSAEVLTLFTAIRFIEIILSSYFRYEISLFQAFIWNFVPYIQQNLKNPLDKLVLHAMSLVIGS